MQKNNKYSCQHKYNTAYDFLRLICTIIIIVHHSEYFFGFLVRGYIVVELFFIISGYMIMQSIEKNPECSTGYFIKKRIIRIFPEYWFSWCVLLVIRIIIHQVPYKHLYSPIADLLLLENIGLPFELEGINYPCWYLSVLLWGGTLVFVLARFLPTKVYRILSVISIIFFYGYVLVNFYSIEQWGSVSHVFYLPFWRGVAGMMTGTLMYHMPIPKKRIGIIVEVFTILALIASLFLKGRYDYLAIVIIFLLLWSVRSDDSILRKLGDASLIKWISKSQYGIFVNHIAMVLLFRKLSLNWVISLIGIIILTFLLACLGKQVSEKYISNNLYKVIKG